MMSSRHGPYVVGHSCVTMVMTKIFTGASPKENKLNRNSN
jgi:hypothetical protein